MSCVLRVSGKNLKVDDIVLSSGLRPSVLWRRGDPRPGSSQSFEQTSGFTVAVTDKDFDDFGGQVRDAIDFLESNRNNLASLAALAEVEVVELDFAVSWPENGGTYTEYLPYRLIAAASECRTALAISHYPTAAR
jgi:Domain of unknown function (DUF4279)